jgi:membrane associated rhomboid family serine protease
MSEPFVDEGDVPRMTRTVQWLVALCLGVFFVQFTLVGAANMQHALGFSVSALPARWWTVGTHPFVHAGFWPLALNVYLLLLFGPRLEQAWGAREFRNYFIWCALGGWILHALFVREGLLLGSTAGVLGVALAYGSRWAEESAYLFMTIPIRVKWLAGSLMGVVVTVGLLSSPDGGAVASLASFGGLAAGWLYLRTAGGAGIDRLRERVSSVPDVPNEPPRAVPRSQPRLRERSREVDDIVAQSARATRQGSVPVNRPEAAPRDRSTDLDRVLEKISQSGLDSLTPEERRVLEERSRELRRDD